MLTLPRSPTANSTVMAATVAVGASYVAVTAWAMQAVSYDIWGALIVTPWIGVLLVALVRRMFSGELHALIPVAMAGLAAKLVGTLGRYWFVTGIYGGAGDSTAYDATGKIIAQQVYDGNKTLLSLIPHTQGTAFINELTGLIYTFTGSSRLAGFIWFAAIGFVGVALIVKAACIAVPDLAQVKYATLCFILPSIVFWPSAIGKEAWMSVTLGAITYGAAKLLKGIETFSAIGWIAVGTLGAAMVRPHMAAIWLAAFVISMVWGVVSVTVQHRTSGRRILLAIFTVAVLAGLLVVARFTVQFLSPRDEVSSSNVSDIFDIASTRSATGGSRFQPVSIAGPLDYPPAILRTLTRPLLYEATKPRALLPALESTGVLVLFALAWRRLVNLPRLLRTCPFVLYSMLLCMMVGLAFSSFANLAILVRQRSLVLAALLLPLCLPEASTSRPKRQGPQPRK